MSTNNLADNTVVLDYSMSLNRHSDILIEIGKKMNSVDESDHWKYELEALADIRQGPHEEHLAEMIKFYQSISNRQPKSEQSTKPPIKLNTYISAKGNLCMEWIPSILKENGSLDWGDFRFRPQSFGDRANNELLYLRSFESLQRIRASSPQRADLRRLVLEAGILLTAELVSRLKLTYDVVELQKLYAVCVLVEQKPRLQRNLVGWSLQRPEEFQLYGEITRLNQWESKNGLEVQTAVDAFAHAVKKKGRGPAPTNLSRIDEKVAHALRTAGHKVSETEIRVLRELLAKHDPQRLPEPLRRVRGAYPVDRNGAGHLSA